MSPLDGIKNFLSTHTEMSSVRNQPDRGFPAVPSSLNAGNYEMRDYYQDRPAYDSPANTAPHYTPYLGLRARLSQIWINRWTVLILLIVVRLLLATNDLKYDLVHAKKEALSACSSVENVGSAMASMPHYLSSGVNALAADGMTEAVHGLGEMLMLTLTGVEEIVTFIINLLTSTYVCLITLAITGSLQAQIKMIEDVGDFMNQSISSITGTMTSDLTSFTDDLDTFLSSINIGGILGNSDDPPRVDLTSQIDALKSIKVDPTKMDAKLNKLNDSIPTFDEVQNFTNSIIALPFETVKRLISDSLGNYTFDRSVFPVAQKQQLTFCSDNDAINNFFDDLSHIVVTVRKVSLAVLVVIAVMVCIPMAYREIWRWRNMQSRSLLLQRHAFDPMDVIYIASRPITTTFGIKFSSKLGGTTKHQILTRWFVAYCTTLPALFVLALGLAGLFSCLCQYILLVMVRKEIPNLIQTVADFADKVVVALNDASTSWARDANAVIVDTNMKINEDVFGWVDTSTTAVNSTLVAFSDQMVTALNQTFGGTILYEPVKGVFDCLVELKIRGIEKGLTWVHDNAHVTLPEFRPDVFSLGAAASLAGNDSSSAGTFLAAPGDKTRDEISDAVMSVVQKLEGAIRQEAIISTCLVGIWVLIALVALARVLYELSRRDRTRAEGGPSYVSTDGAGASGGLYPPQRTTMFGHFRGNKGRIHGERSPRYVEHEDDGWGDVGLHDEGILTPVGDDRGQSENEKIRQGVVGGGQAGRILVGHERKSSYGYVSETKD